MSVRPVSPVDGHSLAGPAAAAAGIDARVNAAASSMRAQMLERAHVLQTGRGPAPAADPYPVPAPLALTVAADGAAADLGPGPAPVAMAANAHPGMRDPLAGMRAQMRERAQRLAALRPEPAEGDPPSNPLAHAIAADAAPGVGPLPVAVLADAEPVGEGIGAGLGAPPSDDAASGVSEGVDPVEWAAAMQASLLQVRSPLFRARLHASEGIDHLMLGPGDHARLHRSRAVPPPRPQAAPEALLGPHAYEAANARVIAPLGYGDGLGAVARADPRWLCPNPLSLYWKREGREWLGIQSWVLAPTIYMTGMIGYALSLPLRVCEVGVKAILLVGHIFFFMITFGRCVKWRDVWIRAKILVGSITDVVSAVIGCACPIIAYRIDEFVQSDRDIHAKSWTRWVTGFFDEIEDENGDMPDLYEHGRRAIVENRAKNIQDSKARLQELRACIATARKELQAVYSGHENVDIKGMANEISLAFALQLYRNGTLDQVPREAQQPSFLSNVATAQSHLSVVQKFIVAEKDFCRFIAFSLTEPLLSADQQGKRPMSAELEDLLSRDQSYRIAYQGFVETIQKLYGAVSGGTPAISEFLIALIQS